MINADKKLLEIEGIKTSPSPHIGKYEKIMNEPEKLWLICNNCGKDWTELRPKGYCVGYEKNNNFLINRYSPYDKKLFKCPKCKRKKNIGRLSLIKTIKTKYGATGLGT